MSAGPSRLMSHVQNGVTIVHFTEAKLVDQRDINLIGAELTKMAESGGVSKMLINMENVRYLSSAMLGKLISLHKTLRTHKATLKLCSIAPPIYEVFEITRLDKVFDIQPTEEKGLARFKVRGF